MNNATKQSNAASMLPRLRHTQATEDTTPLNGWKVYSYCGMYGTHFTFKLYTMRNHATGHYSNKAGYREYTKHPITGELELLPF